MITSPQAPTVTSVNESSALAPRSKRKEEIMIDLTSQDTCDLTSQDKCNLTSQDTCDVTSSNICDLTSVTSDSCDSDSTSRETCDLTSQNTCDLTSQNTCDLTSRNMYDLTSLDMCDLTLAASLSGESAETPLECDHENPSLATCLADQAGNGAKTPPSLLGDSSEKDDDTTLLSRDDDMFQHEEAFDLVVEPIIIAPITECTPRCGDVTELRVKDEHDL